MAQQDTYFLVCQRYIELNPVKAGMVEDPADYSWSSYRANALGVPAKLCTPHEVYLRLSQNKRERLVRYRELFKAHVSTTLATEIEQCVNTGMALGSSKFKSDIEALYKRRVTPGTMGQPTKP